MNSLKAVLAALNVEHGAAGEGLTEVEKKASLEVIIVLSYFSSQDDGHRQIVKS